MTIKTIGYNLEHNLWLVVRLFFDERQDISVVSTAAHKDGIISVDTELTFEGRHHTGSYSYPCANNADTCTKKRILSAVAGMSFYHTVQNVLPKRLPWGVMTGIRPAKAVRRMLEQGSFEADIARYLKTLYGVSEGKIQLALEVAKNEMAVLAENTPNQIGLYIGIPFCPTRCLYCSFVSSDLRHTKKYVYDYCALLAREIAYSAKLVDDAGLKITSLYMGGGTPTALSSDNLALLLDAVHSHFDLSALKEFSVEAGRPDTITPDKLKVLKAASVDRLSINPQTMNAQTLQKIGRAHTPDDIKAAFCMARDAGFYSINADLIAGLPDETEQDFAFTLNETDKLAPESITVHTMSVKRGSALNQHKDSYILTRAETVRKMLDISQSFMRDTGRFPYYMYRQKNMLGDLENVGYAKKGHMSLYNVNIMEETQTILALGGGGVSKVILPECDRIERVFNFKSPIEYINRFDEILTKKDAFYQLAARA